MNGISTNCVCRFADHQIGQKVEWDDDIDLNQWRCPTSAWEKYFTNPTKPMTNADRIRAMSDEELAAITMCPNTFGAEINCYHAGSCVECCTKWLKQPAEVSE